MGPLSNSGASLILQTVSCFVPSLLLTVMVDGERSSKGWQRVVVVLAAAAAVRACKLLLTHHFLVVMALVVVAAR
jgi:hypothetical protein